MRTKRTLILFLGSLSSETSVLHHGILSLETSTTERQKIVCLFGLENRRWDLHATETSWSWLPRQILMFLKLMTPRRHLGSRALPSGFGLPAHCSIPGHEDRSKLINDLFINDDAEGREEEWPPVRLHFVLCVFLFKFLIEGHQSLYFPFTRTAISRRADQTLQERSHLFSWGAFLAPNLLPLLHQAEASTQASVGQLRQRWWTYAWLST